MEDTASAVEKLAAQAKIAQLAAQLRLRLSYARYKTVNKVTKVPFATLERRLEESTPKQSAYSLLLLDGLPLENNRNGSHIGISMDDKSIADALRMPPPPSQSLFTTLLQEIDPRPPKGGKPDSHISAHAGAPDPNGFARFQPSLASLTSPRSNQQSPSKRLYSSTQKKGSASTEAGAKKKKKKSLPMADREQLAAKTLASLLVANGSPRSPVKPKPDAAKKAKSRPHRSSVSSVDASMADAALAISLGDTDDATSRRGSIVGVGDVPKKDNQGSGMDTAPGSPVLSAAQRERDSAELLLLLATSPSPARNNRNPAQRPPAAISQSAGRVLFSEASSSSTTSGPSGGRGAASTSNTPSLLLPAPPSPTKKSSTTASQKSKSQGREERFTVPAHPSLGLSFNPSASSTLQPPFTPGSSIFPTGSSTSSTNSAPFGGGPLGLASFPPSTPTSGFNMADYINFTPTPGGFSPASNPRTGGSGTRPPPASNLSIFAGSSGAASSAIHASSEVKVDDGKNSHSTVTHPP